MQNYHIGVIGLGHIGAVNAACFSSFGYSVTGFDVKAPKVEEFKVGRATISEPQVDELLTKAAKAGLLDAYTDLEGHTDALDAVFVCVGAPPSESGDLDLRIVKSVISELAAEVSKRPADIKPLEIIVRTTLAPGTVGEILLPILIEQSGKQPGTTYRLVFYPEFLREASAVEDFLSPPRIVIGQEHEGNGIQSLLKPLIKAPGSQLFEVNFRTAELIKFVDNTWHALKVGFGNEIGRIALAENVDPDLWATIFLADESLNISKKYLRPGSPFGGTCLGKDVQAINGICRRSGVDTPIIDNVIASNNRHADFLFESIVKTVGSQQKILLSGISFKPNTDDLRDSPYVDLWLRLTELGKDVKIFDPDVNFGKTIAHYPGIEESVFDQLAAHSLVDLGKAIEWADRVIVAKHLKPVSALADGSKIIRIDLLQDGFGRQLSADRNDSRYMDAKASTADSSEWLASQ